MRNFFMNSLETRTMLDKLPDRVKLSDAECLAWGKVTAKISYEEGLSILTALMSETDFPTPKNFRDKVKTYKYGDQAANTPPAPFKINRVYCNIVEVIAGRTTILDPRDLSTAEIEASANAQAFKIKNIYGHAVIKYCHGFGPVLVYGS